MRQTVKDQVADKLAFMIQTGLLRPGDSLPSERQLAATLNVSRESVRGAMTVLSARQMIKISHGNRTRVMRAADVPLHELIGSLAGLDDSDIEQVAEARAKFEIDVVRLAAERIDERDLARLHALVLEQAEMLDDPVRFQISDREFHESLYNACGNRLMANVARDLYCFALDARRRALRREAAIENSVADHRAIVAAVEAGDPERACQTMLRHQERINASTRQELHP